MDKFKAIPVITLFLSCHVFAAPTTPTPVAPPVKCQQDYASYSAWLDGVRKDALEAGVTSQWWAYAQPFMTFDQSVIDKDRQQGGFYKSFWDFAIPRAHSRIDRARKLYKQHGDLLTKIEASYGVPGEILLAFWGMETDFATQPGKKLVPVLSSMATLAFDCRRPELFRPNLINAVLLLQEGDVTIDDLKGEGAGEMSGLQFTPTNYYKYGVDFDGDGKRSVITSVPDMLATGAATLKDYGWRAGEPFLQEVRVPDNMRWEEADLTTTIQHPRGQWSKWGVTTINGDALPNDQLPASLMIPMGKFGPAFLAYNNFKALLLWNASLNNALTAGYFAGRIKNASLAPMSPGRGQVYVLSKTEVEQLQMALKKAGYDVAVDGRLGTGTRAAIKAAQIRFKMPADAYPTLELLRALQ